MRKYDKEFKEEAVKLSDEVGVKQAAVQLGVPYYSLAEWRQKTEGLRGSRLRRQRHPPGRTAFREGTGADEAGPRTPKGQ